LADSVASRVRLDIQQIDQLFSTYQELLDQARQRPPNLIEMTAIASVLHSFYNGIENIFLSIARGVDHHVPTGDQWHRDLLVQMSREMENRPLIISIELARALSNYLGFRHSYRHSYSFILQWTELQELALQVRDIWSRAKREIFDFLENIKNSPDYENIDDG